MTSKRTEHVDADHTNNLYNIISTGDLRGFKTDQAVGMDQSCGPVLHYRIVVS